MTDHEWDAIVATLTANWPHSVPPDDALVKWRADLSDLPPQQVLVAVEAIYRSGREFCPNGAQVRNEVIRLTLDVPDWSEVWRRITEAIARFPFERQDEANAWVGELHPLAGRLAAQTDWRVLRFTTDDITTKEAQARGKWDAIVNRSQREGGLQGLPSAGLPALERVNEEPQLLGDAVKRIGRSE